MKTTRRGFIALCGAGMLAMAAVTRLARVPTVIVTLAKQRVGFDYERDWQAQQKKVSALSREYGSRGYVVEIVRA